MFRSGFMFGDRRNALCFWVGCVVVTIGVGLHLPMFWMARNSGFILAGMPMDPGMLWGMGTIVLGLVAAGYGLLPNGVQGAPMQGTISPPEDAPLTRAHWKLLLVIAMCLIIDIMKPASLGFVTPGMRVEYGLDRATVALLPLSALIGTTVGSFVWGALADLYGRRASLLLSSVMFIGTSICGAMPSFWWNVAMCLLMGAAAGGLLPVAYALLAEVMPTKHRGWCLVLVGGIGAIGGYLAASGLSAWLQPHFGWRILWFLNIPTGLLIIALSPLIPESARFLQQIGRLDKVEVMLSAFGVTVRAADAPALPVGRPASLQAAEVPGEVAYAGQTVALTLAALAWGLVNFGILLWLPSALVAEGRSVSLASLIIAKSTVLAAPVVAILAYFYSRWSTKWLLAVMIGMTILGLLAVLLRGNDAFPLLSNPIASLVLLIIGSSGVISILLPYAAESYPMRIRGRATGWVAGCSKFGGLIAQGLSVLALVPSLGTAALCVAVPAVASLVLIARFGRETRGRDLRELESPVTRAIGGGAVLLART